MANYKLKIEKIDENNYIIDKNKNFEYLLKSSYILYQHILLSDSYEDYASKFGNENSEFVDMMITLMNEDPIAVVSPVHLKDFRKWLDVLCVITLQRDQTNLKDKEVKKYLKMAELFNEKITEFFPN